MKTLTILSIIFVTAQSLAYRQEAGDTSIYNECLWNKQVVDINVDCNDLFNHYLPKKSSYKPQSELRFGSYNIFRSYEQQQKRWDLTAEMIEGEWDLVALSEVQPNKSSFLQMNVNAVIALNEKKITETEFKKSYNLPSYLKMLFELQKRDPSWGLIISPYSQSEADTEHFAFLYRGNQVKPIESQYCHDQYIKTNPFKKAFIYQEIKAESYLLGSANSLGVVKSKNGKPISNREFVTPKEALACVLALDHFGQENVPKIPFTARFQSGKFDSSYISLHLGFRGPYEVNGKDCKEECQKHTRSLIDTMLKSASDADQKLIRDKMKLDKDLGRESSRQLNRFFQLHETLKAALEIKKLEKDQDVIVAGDFNLELTKSSWQGPLWNHFKNIFEDGELLVKEKTSLSEAKGYASNYDHFILSIARGNSDECDISSAKRIDFLNPELVLSNGFKLGAEINQYNDIKSFEEITNILTREYQEKLWVSSQGELFNAEQLKKISDESTGTDYRSLQIQVKEFCDEAGPIKGQSAQWLDIPTAMKHETFCKLHSKKPYLKYMATMSDHVPISMTCSANTGD